MADRNWGAWRREQEKFSSVKSSQDFRRKRKGMLARFVDWLKGLFGKR